MTPAKMNDLLARMTPDAIRDGLWLVGVLERRGRLSREKADPTEHGRVPTVKEAGTRQGYLTMAEVENVIARSPAWLGNIVRFSVATGMRLGEVTSLTRASYQMAIVNRGEAPIPACVVTNTKNGSTLVYPLHGWPLDHVRARVERAQFPGTPIFPGPGGSGARSAILRYLPKAVKKVGLEWGKYRLDDNGKPVKDKRGNKVLNPNGITFHSLRHHGHAGEGKGALH